MTERPEPKWDAVTMNRECGETTFKTCGWCEHRGCGSMRYDCLLDGGCSLMKDYGELHKVQWDTPCHFGNLGKKDIADIIDSKHHEINSAKESIKRTEDEITVLEKLASVAVDSPPLPDNRDHDHFNINDRVAVAWDGHWIAGTVVMGYRHHDGCVSYWLDGQSKPDYKLLSNPWDKKKNPKGWKEHQALIAKIGKLAEAPGCGTATPCVVLMKEWQYFVDHPKEYEAWRKTVMAKDYNGKYFKESDLPQPEPVTLLQRIKTPMK